MTCLEREEFSKYVGGRHREALTVFHDLDTDFDGMVDIFEVLTLLTLWSGAAWSEKEELLFDIFDIMGKGFLKVDEVMFMGQVMLQTLSKFAKLDCNVDTVQFSQSSFTPGEHKLDVESFRAWTAKNADMKKLRKFLEDHATRSAPLALKETRMQLKCREIDTHVTSLFQRVEQLQEVLPEFTEALISHVDAWGRRKRWDFTVQNLRQLILKLLQDAEMMSQMLIEVTALLQQDEASGGLIAVVEPTTRFAQEQKLNELEATRAQTSKDFLEMTSLLSRLIELTEPTATPAVSDDLRTSLGVIVEENDDFMEFEPPKVLEQRTCMKRVLEQNQADLADGGALCVKPAANLCAIADDVVTDDLGLRPKSGASAVMDQTRELAQTGGEEGMAELVVVANFEPPPSHQTQMLSLTVGELVAVIGQDGRGWWYGRKGNGAEGWFPPTYVQLKGAHFSSSGDAFQGTGESLA